MIRNKKIVITGTMPDATRDEWSERLASVGAMLQPRVDGNTHYLVAAEPKPGHPPTQKVRDALKNGVSVVSPDWLIAEYAKETQKVQPTTSANRAPTNARLDDTRLHSSADLTEVLRAANEAMLSPDEREASQLAEERAKAEGRLAALRLATKANELMPDESMFEV